MFFFVNQRSVPDRYNNLICKYKQKRNKEENASGINPQHTKMDDFLQELDSLFKESERGKNARLDEKKKKSEEDRKKALKV